MCTTCNVVQPLKDISELKYFGDLNLKKNKKRNNRKTVWCRS